MYDAAPYNGTAHGAGDHGDETNNPAFEICVATSCSSTEDYEKPNVVFCGGGAGQKKSFSSWARAQHRHRTDGGDHAAAQSLVHCVT